LSRPYRQSTFSTITLHLPIRMTINHPRYKVTASA
jgi:hypothetical protein